MIVVVFLPLVFLSGIAVGCLGALAVAWWRWRP